MPMGKQQYQQALNQFQFTKFCIAESSPNGTSKDTLHGPPMSVRCGMSFGSSRFDLYYVLIIVHDIKPCLQRHWWQIFLNTNMHLVQLYTYIYNTKIIHEIRSSKVYTHWGQVMLCDIIIMVDIGSADRLKPVWYQTITWNNDDLSSMGPLGTNFLKSHMIKNTIIWENTYVA